STGNKLHKAFHCNVRKTKAIRRWCFGFPVSLQRPIPQNLLTEWANEVLLQEAERHLQRLIRPVPFPYLFESQCESFLPTDKKTLLFRCNGNLSGHLVRPQALQ